VFSSALTVSNSLLPHAGPGYRRNSYHTYSNLDRLSQDHNLILLIICFKSLMNGFSPDSEISCHWLISVVPENSVLCPSSSIKDGVKGGEHRGTLGPTKSCATGVLQCRDLWVVAVVLWRMLMARVSSSSSNNEFPLFRG
jgi:hypothetical protein